MRYSTQQLRQKALLAIEKGRTAIDVADALGVHRSSIYRWVTWSQKDETLARRKGSGRPGAFSDENAARLLKLIMKPATSFGFETDFWTSARLIKVAKQQLRITVSRSTMCKMLRDSEFSYKKPERRYYQASEDLRQEWIRVTVPKIKRLARKKRAILYFEDEATIRLTGVLARTWGPKGQRIVKRVTGLRGTIPVISALNPNGKLIFKLLRKKISSKEVIQFLSQMLKQHPRRHLIVVMDRARPHTSQETTNFIRMNPRLHVFYLPPYSPDLNPDEQVWNYLKNEELKSHKANSTEELRKLSQQKLRRLAKSRTTLRALFFRSHVADFFA